VKDKQQRRRKSGAGGGALGRLVKSTGVSRAILVAYCEYGILPVSPEELPGQENDDAFIRSVRRIEYLREHHGINLDGIRIIAGLMREVERLREELRFQTRR
jgi:hypothetical protein